MMKVRNRLLILLALLLVALFAFRGVASAGGNFIDRSPDLNIGVTTGEPDQPSGIKTTATSSREPSEAGSAPVVSRAQWFLWAGKIWAAMHLGLIR